MDQHELRGHLESAAGVGGAQNRNLTSRMMRSCWPGGSEDRIEKAALAWVRRWRPEKVGATLPACSCITGRCAVCN